VGLARAQVEKEIIEGEELMKVEELSIVLRNITWSCSPIVYRVNLRHPMSS